MATASVSLLTPAAAKAALGVTGTLLVGGGLICSAGHALPGSPLFPIKVGINEPVSAGLAVTPGAKANVAVNRAGERLNEAQQLAVDNELTGPLANDVSRGVRNAANEAEQELAILSETNPGAAADLAANLQAMLEGNGGLLASLGPQADGNAQAALQNLSGTVKAEARDAKTLALALASKAGPAALEAQARAQLANAKGRVDAARAKLNALKGSLDASSAAEANAQLAAASRLLANGQTDIANKAFVHASDQLTAAGSLADQASLFGNAMANLKADSNLNADAVINAAKNTGNASAGLTGSAGGTVNGTVNGGAAGSTVNGGATGGINVDLNGTGGATVNGGGTGVDVNTNGSGSGTGGLNIDTNGIILP